MRSAPGTPAAIASFFGRLCLLSKPPPAKPRRMLVTWKNSSPVIALCASAMLSAESLRSRNTTSLCSRTVSCGSLGKRRVGSSTGFCARRSNGRWCCAAAWTRAKYGSPHATVTPRPAGFGSYFASSSDRTSASRCCALRRSTSCTVAVITSLCNGGTSTGVPSLCVVARSKMCCSAGSSAAAAGRTGTPPLSWSTSSYTPAAPSAVAAAPPRNLRRVSFISTLRADEHEAVQQQPEIVLDLRREPVRSDHVLAGGVERPVVAPGEQDVPLIRALVDLVDRRVDPVRLHVRDGLAEAGDLALADGRGTARDRGAPRIAAEVHVHVAAPEIAVLEEADEEAPVLADRVDVLVLAADPRVERVRHPGRAVDGRVHLVRERLPPLQPGGRARPLSGRTRTAGSRQRERGGGRDEQSPHGARVAPLDVGW